MKSALIHCLCAGLFVATAALADEQQAAAIDQQSSSAVSSSSPLNADTRETLSTVAPAIVNKLDQAESGQPLSEADLDSYHGGTATVTANQTLTAITSDNVLNGDYVAGSVTLSDEALSNFNGFGNFAINTGAQVSIQSAMSVTINVGE